MWSMKDWDAKAEAVHKISIETLRREGFDSAAVLLELTRELPRLRRGIRCADL
jgi:hypothetical protein